MTEAKPQIESGNTCNGDNQKQFLCGLFDGHLREVLQGGPVALFGAGALGAEICEILKIKGVTPFCFCDNNRAKWGTSYHHTPVISFEELNVSYHDCLVLITSQKYSQELELQLLENGFARDRIITPDIEIPDQVYRPAVTVRTTQKCNSRCIMCFHRKIEPVKDLLMPMSEFRGILAKVLPYTDTISFTDYGEFLCDPLVFERFDLLRDKIEGHQTFHQITNGSLLSKENIDRCFGGLNNVSLAVSLDTMDEELYRKIRQNGHFRKVIENVRNLRTSLHSAGVENVTLCLSMAMMRANLATLPDLIRFAGEVGSGVYADHLDLSCASKSLNGESLFHFRDWSNGIVDECIKLASDLKVDFCHPPLFGEGEDAGLHCNQVVSTGPISILPGGDVKPCCMSQLSMGNINDNSYTDIINGSRVTALREAIETGSPPSSCQTCRFLYPKNKHLNNPKFYGLDL